MSIRHAKVFSDFKDELLDIRKDPLEKRGETLRILNPGGLWQKPIGEGDSYNTLDISVDGLHRPGGLRDVPDGLRNLSAQILPEPAQTDGENTYWWEGLRRAIANAVLLEAMVEEYDATLSSVALLIEDRDALGVRNQARRQSPTRSIDHSGGLGGLCQRTLSNESRCLGRPP